MGRAPCATRAAGTGTPSRPTGRWFHDPLLAPCGRSSQGSDL